MMLKSQMVEIASEHLDQGVQILLLSLVSVSWLCSALVGFIPEGVYQRVVYMITIHESVFIATLAEGNLFVRVVVAVIEFGSSWFSGSVCAICLSLQQCPGLKQR